MTKLKELIRVIDGDSMIKIQLIDEDIEVLYQGYVKTLKNGYKDNLSFLDDRILEWIVLDVQLCSLGAFNNLINILVLNESVFVPNLEKNKKEWWEE